MGDDTQEPPQREDLATMRTGDKRTTSGSLLAARIGAVLLTTGVGAASFALSFAALRDLAIKAHVAAHLAWLWPLIIDGTILLATLGVVVLAAFPEHRRDRLYFWWVLACAAAVSIAANTLHAIVPADEPLNPWLTGAIGGVAPVSLLATTHGLVILTRAGRQHAHAGIDAEDAPGDLDPAESTSQADAAAGRDEPVSLDQYARWRDMAAAVLDRQPLRLRPSSPAAAVRKDDDVATVAKALHLSYDRAWTHRQIGTRLGMSHHTVGKIITTSALLLREGHFSVAAAS